MSHLDPLRPGFLLRGRYQIVQIVGQGGMGRVYKAFDMQKKGKVVAVKEMLQGNLLPKDLARSKERFLQEAAFLQNLTRRRHEHLPAFYDAFSEDDRCYLIMDFIEGKTLYRLLQEAPENRLPVDKALLYASQLCEVLSDLHQQSPPIIFRDLKPPNVIITSDNVVYLIDFGVARHFKNNQSVDTELFRSFGYSPPELGLEQTEPRSDLYSLGATLYQCLTGQHPRNNAPSIYHFAALNESGMHFPAALDDLVMRLVATSLSKRPASASAVLSELRQIKQFFIEETTEPFLLPQDQEVKTYYDPRLAQEAQLRLKWERLNRLPGEPGRLWLKMLPFFAALGSWFIYSSRDVFLVACRKLGLKVLQLARSARARRRRPPGNSPGPQPPIKRPPTKQPSSAGLRSFFVTVRMSAPGLQNSVSAAAFQQSSYWPPFLGLLTFTLLASLELVVGQHQPPLLLACIFGPGLLLFVLVAGIRQPVARGIQSLLSALVLAMTLISASALSQPSLVSFLNGMTLNLLLVGALVLLGMLSFFRPLKEPCWSVHLFISAGAALCFFLQYTLGPLSMPFWSRSLTDNVNLCCLVLLGMATLAPLIQLGRSFSPLDCVALFVVALFCAWLFADFGLQALQVLSGQSLAAFSVIKEAAPLALVVLAFLSFYLKDRAWGVVVYLALALLLLLTCTLLLLPTSALLPLSPPPSWAMLAVKPFAAPSLQAQIMGTLAALALLLFYQLVRRSRFLFVDGLLVIALALLTLLLQTFTLSHLTSAASFTRAMTQASPVVSWGIGISLAFLLLSPLLHLFFEPGRVTRLVAGIDQLILLLEYLLLLFVSLTCLAYQWDFGPEENALHRLISVSPAIYYDQLLLLLPAAMALIALIRGSMTLHCLLRALGRPGSSGRPLTEQDGPARALHFLDRCVLLAAVGFLALFFLLLEPFSAAPVQIAPVLPVHPLSLWLIILGLFLGFLALLAWLRHTFTQVLLVLCWSLLACTLLAAVALLLPISPALLAFSILAALVLLFQGIFFALWMESKLRHAERERLGKPA